MHFSYVVLQIGNLAFDGLKTNLDRRNLIIPWIVQAVSMDIKPKAMLDRKGGVILDRGLSMGGLNAILGASGFDGWVTPEMNASCSREVSASSITHRNCMCQGSTRG